ncbi:MAG: DUF1569 domain-containing protein [Pseudomonadota bacterium]
MKRLQFFRTLAVGGVANSAKDGTWLALPRENANLNIDKAIQRLDELDLANLVSTGSWSVARTFDHLRQGIEFSMAGYPEEKSKLFQKTIGHLAFSVFRARGAMTHALDEVIPGERLAASSRDPLIARADLIRALEDFRDSDGTLKPHFAYGKLDKSDYAIAHVLHIQNHMDEFT